MAKKKSRIRRGISLFAEEEGTPDGKEKKPTEDGGNKKDH